ncbi:hypothetical protein FXO38_30232 [Capsicum annuum]|nr:hypothetical protein FXO38_30232 [Capsicum annuum]
MVYFRHSTSSSSEPRYLLISNHKDIETKNIASTLPCLGRRIINGENRWGETFQLNGEFHYIPGYWEWTEDVLNRSYRALKDAKIYYVVYGSLFTYDHNTNILQAFCEAWCPTTNTLLTSVGEMSLSLCDLHTIGGLPITGSLYEEVVPDVTELMGTYDKGKRFFS